MTGWQALRLLLAARHLARRIRRRGVTPADLEELARIKARRALAAR